MVTRVGRPQCPILESCRRPGWQGYPPNNNPVRRCGVGFQPALQWPRCGTSAETKSDDPQDHALPTLRCDGSAPLRLCASALNCDGAMEICVYLCDLWAAMRCRDALHPAPCILHPASCTLHPASCILHPASCILHPASCILHPAPCTLHPAPCTLRQKRPGRSRVSNQSLSRGDGSLLALAIHDLRPLLADLGEDLLDLLDLLFGLLLDRDLAGGAPDHFLVFCLIGIDDEGPHGVV